MPTIKEVQRLQRRFDELDAMRKTLIGDFTVGNQKKREIAVEFAAVRRQLRAASKAFMAASREKWEAENGRGAQSSEALPAASPISGASNERHTTVSYSPPPATSEEEFELGEAGVRRSGDEAANRHKDPITADSLIKDT